MRLPFVFLLLLTLLSGAACVAVTPATDTGALVTTTGPSTTGGGTTTSGGSMGTTGTTGSTGSTGTYSQTMTAVRAGSASSILVAVTATNGSMYRYWSGTSATRQAKAAQMRSWVVSFNAQENR